ncbi:MAG: DUF3553 domain-containing protein [Rhodospirillaceae bacterium]|nr:DUF3553 domain-containing protein [Rhodospirillaceae bacterium]
MDLEFVPGVLVINPNEEDWGLGQVQSAVGPKVTVNFENMGKIVINTAVVHLDVIIPEDLPLG